jgi:hypothetical protein
MQVAGKLAMREEDSRNNYGKTQKIANKRNPPRIFFFQKTKSAGDLKRKSLDFQGKKKLAL